MIVDFLKAEPEERSDAYKQFDERFGALTKFSLLTSHELIEKKRKGKKSHFRFLKMIGNWLYVINLFI